MSKPDPGTIKIGQVNLSFYGAAGGVVAAVLERLGHDFAVSQGTHGEIYDQLGEGSVDLLVASWLPNAHAGLHEPLADSLVEVSTLYEDALLYWAVPDYVPESLVSSVEDLARPEVAQRMDRTIVSVGPGSGLSLGSARILEEYGLENEGYVLEVAGQDRWVANARAIFDAERWAAIPLWRPQWMNSVFGLRVLAEPRGIFAPDRCVLVARKAAWDSWPTRLRTVLGRIELDLDSVSDIDRSIAVDGLTPRAAADRWIAAHEERFDSWFV